MKNQHMIEELKCKIDCINSVLNDPDKYTGAMYADLVLDLTYFENALRELEEESND